MRKHLRKETDFVAQIEQYAEQFLDISAEERRLLKTLTRIRAVKAALISGLARTAKAAADVQK
jgi:hypothetical protein